MLVLFYKIFPDAVFVSVVELRETSYKREYI